MGHFQQGFLDHSVTKHGVVGCGLPVWSGWTPWLMPGLTTCLTLLVGTVTVGWRQYSKMQQYWGPGGCAVGLVLNMLVQSSPQCGANWVVFQKGYQANIDVV